VTQLWPTDWQQLEPLIDQILDAEPSSRPTLIERLSEGDAARRAELERLVTECERADRLLERPAAERFAALFGDEGTSLTSPVAERYHLTRELGRGGMAVVYLARDLKHDRDVAVKVVRPELAAALGRARFLREIEIAAKLHHPNIVSLYDSGEAEGVLYYVMPYEPGLSLRQKLVRDGQLPVADALTILRDVAEAMSYAHQQGVVHRDIKPENVMLNGRHAVVTDFGVAKALTAATGGQTVTTPGLALGTPAYMAPEQITADPRIDNRADIYAFGAMAYEMLSGRPPFVRPTAHAVLGAHVSEQPQPVAHQRPSISPQLAALVMKCLEKDATQRWQSADDLLREIETITARPLPPVRAPSWKSRVAIAAVVLALPVLWKLWPSRGRDDGSTRQASFSASGVAQPSATIAVLPFENHGPAADDYFAAGMTEEITSRLGAISGVNLVSRRAAQRFARSDLSMREIGSALGTNYLLTGSVRWSENDSTRVRITLELLRARDERQLWSEKYDRVIDDIFKVQSAIADQVIKTLGVTLREEERGRLNAEPTANQAAYRLYLKGRYYWNKRTEENIQIALNYFQQAVDLDPGYSLAWVGIADTWIQRGWYSRLAPREAFPKAKSAALRALEFDSTLSEAHASLAHIHLEFDHDWEAAEREYRRAIELNPKNSIAHHWYGGFLSAMGRHDEALAQAESARTLDPLAPIIQTWVGLKYYFAGRYESAIAEFSKALQLDRDFAPAYWHMGWAYEQAGRFDEGIAAAERAAAQDSGSLLYPASLAHAYAKAGKREQARATLARLMREAAKRHVSAYHVAVVHIALGETQAGLDWLERALAEQSPWIGYLKVDPRIDPVRSQSRFQQLLRKARL
jgi:eukaryotic-like serine/threonine-protein kinase